MSLHWERLPGFLPLSHRASREDRGPLVQHPAWPFTMVTHHRQRVHGHASNPERWLESLVVQDVTEVDERLDATSLYSQLPAFSASDRAMIDVLTTTRDGRLAVVELKADEDIHLPLQGLDYWSRVAWHMRGASFSASDTFPGGNCHPIGLCCFWWLRRCMRIPPPVPCCTTCRLRSSGWLWALMSAGAMGSGSCFGNARETWN